MLIRHAGALVCSVQASQRRIHYAAIRLQDGAYLGLNTITLFRSVYLESEKTGSIEIVSDLSGIGAGLREYSKVAVLVLFVPILATYLISTRLLRISEATRLWNSPGLRGGSSAQENYSLRASAKSNDESRAFS